MPSFRGPGGSFAPFGSNPVVQNVPVTNDTYIMLPGQRLMYFNHAATIAVLNINLPQADDSGELVNLKFRSIVTTLAIRNNLAVTVTGAPVAATAGQLMSLRWIDPTIGWIVW